ncbi:hypothetical protein lerEdw1_009086 [Lerista edwardsae]|nr:hypothetical protein lerEdw1_009086 [Lerista edwardsae]
MVTGSEGYEGLSFLLASTMLTYKLDQSPKTIKVWSAMWLFMVVACLIQQSANTEELIRKRHQNPQEFMDIDEIITYWGYPSEQYQILTEDGYYLQVNRIPYGVHSPGKTGLLS